MAFMPLRLGVQFVQSPQATTVPSDFNAREDEAVATTLLRLGGTGKVASGQANTRPFEVMPSRPQSMLVKVTPPGRTSGQLPPHAFHATTRPAGACAAKSNLDSSRPQMNKKSIAPHRV